jgi:hypothetical protein
LLEAVGEQIISASFCFPDPKLFEETVLTLGSIRIAPKNNKQSRRLHVVKNPLLLISQAKCKSLRQHSFSRPIDCLHPHD